MREKKMGSDAYRKALDSQVKSSKFLFYYLTDLFIQYR